MARISELRNAIKSGVSRQHRWRVTIDLPTYAGSSEDARSGSALARTANIPSYTMGVIELGYSGRILPVPGDRQFEEFTVNFLHVNDMKFRRSLEKWSENVNGTTSNTGLSNLDDIMRDITLELLDSNDQTTRTFVLKDAWPSNMTSGDLDQNAMDSTIEYTVTFRYVELETDVSR